MAQVQMLNRSRALLLSTPLPTIIPDNAPADNNLCRCTGRASDFPCHLLQLRPQSRLVGHEVAGNPPRLKRTQQLADARARWNTPGHDIAAPEREVRRLPTLGQGVAMLPGWSFWRVPRARPAHQHARAVGGRAIGVELGP